MDGEEVSTPLRDLPEELVERILAMVPFPQIFKARALSKSWLARLSPVSSQDDDEKRRLAISFQKRVCEWSFKWKTFCPVFFGSPEEGLVLYDRETHNWQTMPTLPPFLKNHLGSDRVWGPRILQIEGALLFIVTFPRNGPGSLPGRSLFVANVLTRSWKQLPPPPTDGLFHTGRGKLVSDIEMYKVIQFYLDEDSLHLALIYSSKLGAWSRKRLDISRDLKLHGNSASLNGVLYWLVGLRNELTGLLAFSVEEEIFEELQMPLTYFFEDDCRAGLVVNNGSLLMVVCEYPYNFCNNPTVAVSKIDLESRACFVMTRGPQVSPAPLTCDSLYKQPPTDGDCIFFLGEKHELVKLGLTRYVVQTGETYEGVKLGITRYILTYNVREDEWSSFPLTATVYQDGYSKYDRCPFSFHPGLCPFVDL